MCFGAIRGFHGRGYLRELPRGLLPRCPRLDFVRELPFGLVERRRNVDGMQSLRARECDASVAPARLVRAMRPGKLRGHGGEDLQDLPDRVGSARERESILHGVPCRIF